VGRRQWREVAHHASIELLMKKPKFKSGDVIVNASVVSGDKYTYINEDGRGIIFGVRVGCKKEQVLQLGEREAYELHTP